MEEKCTFCKIIKGEQSADFLYQDESLVVFKDIRPHAPVHLLIVPKEHIRSLNDLKEKDKDIISEMIVRAKEMAKGTIHCSVRLPVALQRRAGWRTGHFPSPSSFARRLVIGILQDCDKGDEFEHEIQQNELHSSFVLLGILK